MIRPLMIALLAFAIAGCATNGKAEESEVAVTLNDLPPAVRATLERESVGGTLVDIEKETTNGKVVYSADVDFKGVVWDLEMAEDGTLLSKEKD
jgi:hypothetical protein